MPRLRPHAPAQRLMSGYLGIIGGSSFLNSSYFQSGGFAKSVVATQHGAVTVYTHAADGVVFVQRHAADPAVEYSPPHMINKKAIIAALQQLGVARVLAFNSVGSMNDAIPLGALVVPHDFLCLDPITFFGNSKRGHLVPSFDAAFRSKIIAALQQAAFSPVVSAVYYQSHGPRFETRAEIALFAAQSDIVGMTSAHEAILAQEVGLPYASVCMVDNWANGVSPAGGAGGALTTDEFHAGVARNLKTMEGVLAAMVAAFKPSAQDQEEAKSNDAGKERVALLVHARWVVPVTAAAPGEVLERHSVAVNDAGRIVAVLPTAEAKARFTAANEEDLSERHVLHPGLVNAHTHIGMTLLRGYADDKNVLDWLQEDIWPAENTFVSPGFVDASAQLAIAEMVKGGTTAINDMYHVPAATADALLAAGMRGTVGFPLMDFPDKSAAKGLVEAGIAAKEATAAKDAAGLIKFAVCPHAPYTVCDENMTFAKETARAHGMRVHSHVHENEAEVTDSINGTPSMACHRSDQRTAPLDNLHRLGLVDETFVAVHMTQLTQPQIDMLGRQKAHVVHCPYSNLKLASGFTLVQALLAAGVNVAIGTDSTASNNSLDMYAEMKLAAVLAKAVAKDPTAVPAVTALQMATLNGAKAMGMEADAGSIEVGKCADMTAVEFGSINTLPLFNVISHLVYATGREAVTDVWCNGRRMLQGRTLTCIDEKEVARKAMEWGSKIGDFRDEQIAKRAKKE